MTYILGINCAYHESSACMVKDGVLLTAVEEERFNRHRHAKPARVDNADELPIKSIEFCLENAGITFNDVDHIGFSLNPEARLENKNFPGDIVQEGSWGTENGEDEFYSHVKNVPRLISSLAGFDIGERFHWVNHHLCHTASTYFVSGFDESATLSIDGIGETTSTAFGFGKGNKIVIQKTISYPNSLGFIWEKFSKFLGFSEYDAGKVMGLAAYGNPDKYIDIFKKIVTLDQDGGFAVDLNVLRFRSDSFSALEALFGHRRLEGGAIEKRHKDIAAALQEITNDTVMNMVRYLRNISTSNNLCMAGGVALNCDANRLVLESKLFNRIFIQPGSNDAGTAVGAAFYIWHQILGNGERYKFTTTYLGPSFGDNRILTSLQKHDDVLRYSRVVDIASRVAQLLKEGKVVAWFQGAMEFGPRALGNRSILANPSKESTRDWINVGIKKREPFRPLAPSVLAEHASEWLYIPANSDAEKYMLYGYTVREDKKFMIPAVVHIDGTSRAQLVYKNDNPKYYSLIEKFYELTGIPLVLNTSFNIREPIVCTPEDAIRTFADSKLDYLAIGDYLVSKSG